MKTILDHLYCMRNTIASRIDEVVHDRKALDISYKMSVEENDACLCKLREELKQLDTALEVLNFAKGN